MLNKEPCTLHHVKECLKCAPPDEYYRWQIEHNEINIFYLPDYWKAKSNA